MLAWWTGWAGSPSGISWTFWGQGGQLCYQQVREGCLVQFGLPSKRRPWCAKLSGRWLEQWQKRRSWGSCLFSALRRWRGLYIAVCGYMIKGEYREGKRYTNKLPPPVPRWAFVYCWLLLQQIFDTMGSRIKVLPHRDKAKKMHTLFFAPV